MTIYNFEYSFPNLEPVCCSVSGSNCCFMPCIQISQEAGKVVLNSHLFKNFPQFIVILGSIITNKASGGDRIPVELFQILKDDAEKVLHSEWQQIWKTQQWPQDWKRSVFIPIPKKGNAKECSNYRTIALISHASKVMLKILPSQASTVHELWTSRCSSWV